EVVGFRGERVLLLPFSDLAGIAIGSCIRIQEIVDHVYVSDNLLGRVLDPFLVPIDGGFAPKKTGGRSMAIERSAPNPLVRKRVEIPLSLGVRAIDAALTLGEGQRIGIMAGSGVGKSVLMGMMARGSQADVNVIALIGERGREVREFLERDLGPKGLARSVVIVVTSDESPLMRIRGAKVATAVAEYFAESGKKVL